jgi:hypothetical protein
MRKRYYIIQQGVDSVTKNGRHFDIRVHLMRIHRKWKVAGSVGRLAVRNAIVTNAYSGGISKHLDLIFSQHLGYNPYRTRQTIRKLHYIAIEAAKTISRHHPTWSEFGLDMGIDSKNRVWIYEINISPGTLVFKNLDKQSYRHVLALREKAS